MKQNYRGPFVVIAIIALLMAIGAGVWFVRPPGKVTAPPAAAPTAQRRRRPRRSPAPSARASMRSMSVPTATAVIAGRAAPGAKVTVLDHGDADRQRHRRSERRMGGDDRSALGARRAGSDLVGAGARRPPRHRNRRHPRPSSCPKPPAQPPVAVALPQGPGAARSIGAVGARAPRHVALDMVEYDASGRTILSGRADPGANVEIFIDDHVVGSATPAADGGWSLALQTGVPVGLYHLRLVSRGADGKAEETTLDMRRAAPGELGGGDYLAVVPGNNLWHLARRSYGDGLRYVEIYRANQLRDRRSQSHLPEPAPGASRQVLSLRHFCVSRAQGQPTRRRPRFSGRCGERSRRNDAGERAVCGMRQPELTPLGGVAHVETETRKIHRRDRPSRWRANSRAAHSLGPHAAAARRADRRDLSAGAQIRTRRQSRFGRAAVPDFERPQRADQLFLRGRGRRGAEADQSARAHGARDRAQLHRHHQRALPGSAESSSRAHWPANSRTREFFRRTPSARRGPRSRRPTGRDRA